MHVEIYAVKRIVFLIYFLGNLSRQEKTFYMLFPHFKIIF